MIATISFFSELRYKEVIDIHSGFRLGYVCDAEYDDAEGRIRFCPEFDVTDPEALMRFDAQFPPKVRLRLPGQL